MRIIKKEINKTAILTIVLLIIFVSGVSIYYLTSIKSNKETLSQQGDIVFSGILQRMDRPEPKINYDYRLKLDKPYFDDLDAMGPKYVDYFIVVPNDDSVKLTLEKNIDKETSLSGVIEWGLAETRYFRVIKVLKQ